MGGGIVEKRGWFKKGVNKRVFKEKRVCWYEWRKIIKKNVLILIL